ncbi:MAG: type IV pilus secretin PilQ [Myxococcales bacterium]|nr:type IV pilus secretin PilQ [Myxococcales bacterium]
MRAAVRWFQVSFIPLMLVLAGLIGTTVWLDRRAEALAERPTIIRIERQAVAVASDDIAEQGMGADDGEAEEDSAAEAHPAVLAARRARTRGDTASAVKALEAALAAEKARVAQLESAQAAGRLDQQVNALQTQVEAARREARDAEAARLDTELARLRNDSKRLRDELNTRDTQLANARGEADRSRAAADRLEGELAAARKSEAQAQAKAETERKARSDAQAKAETERKARAEAQAKAETERKARTEAQAKVASERKALADEKAKTAAERKANAQAKADAERKADAQAKAEAQAKADAERKARAEAQAEAERLAAEPPAPQSTRVTQVDFDDSGSRTRVRIVFSGRADYALKREGERTRILEFKNATIEPSIERSLDTSEFTGAVKLISSFQAPPPGDRVRVVVTLGTEVDDEVNVKGDTLTWSFARPAPPVLVGSTPPPPSWQAPPPVVAREVRYEQPRAAVFTGPAQAIAVAETKQKPARRKRYTGRKINVDIKDGDIHNILRLLAKEGNVNIVTSDEVEGTVTMHLKLVPWDQALDIILRTKSLDMVREGDIIRVALAETIAKERDAELKKQEVKEKLLPLGVKLITVNHANAAELIPRVSSVLSGRGKAEYDERTNTVILTDVADHLDAAEDIIRRLDTQTPQVLIETRIIEVNEVNQQELGIQWGVDAIFSAATGNPTGLRFPSTIGISGGADDSQTVTEGNSSNPNYVVNLPAAVGSGSGGALGLTFGSVDSTFNLNVRLSALENRGTVKIISSPKITTLDNKEAEISQGVSIPIAQVSAAGVQTVFFDAVLSLKVTPHVTQDGNIYLTLEAENNTPDFQNVGARGDPTILKKEAKTELLLKDGDTTVIGGIYTSNAGFNTSEVPYLGRIPILGALFRNYRESDRRTELLIFVTPRIVNRAAATVRTVQ